MDLANCSYRITGNPVVPIVACRLIRKCMTKFLARESRETSCLHEVLRKDRDLPKTFLGPSFQAEEVAGTSPEPSWKGQGRYVEGPYTF